MQISYLCDDSLIEITTFLARRWAFNKNVKVEFANINRPKTHLQNAIITLPSIEKYSGDDFDKYRQLRTTLWYESMRIYYCDKILSDDHVFGFILNTIETRRIEMLGRKIWRGMDRELIVNYERIWRNRPLLSSVYGRARIVEAFYQYFLLNDFKGDIPANDVVKIKKATILAKNILNKSLENNYGTEWISKKIVEIIKILQIDSLLTISIPLFKRGQNIPMNEEEVLNALKKISQNREYFSKIEPKKALEGKEIKNEFNAIIHENRKNESKGVGNKIIGISTPNHKNVNEMSIYDNDLISSLKIKFRSWRTGWREEHVQDYGDEFDAESYIEDSKPFLKDFRKIIKTRIMILLDHSSSIASDQIKYKKTTLSLCEVLAYLRIKFSIYAFNTENRAVMCWSIKDEGVKWNNTCAKRLASVQANGGTPLADVYNKMHHLVSTKKPDILLTLTDGEPSDPDAVRRMTSLFKNIGTSMISIGLGSDIIRSMNIANNLKQLGYEKSLAVYNLNDIPKKILGILNSS